LPLNEIGKLKNEKKNEKNEKNEKMKIIKHNHLNEIKAKKREF
jgi:hypothetical protein